LSRATRRSGGHLSGPPHRTRVPISCTLCSDGSGQPNCNGTPDGATKIEVLIYPTPSQLSPADALQQGLDQSAQRGEPRGTITKQSVTVAGRASLEVIEGPHGGNVFGGYTITYMIPHGANMLWLSQAGLTSGAPSAILTHMVQSLTLTGA